MGRIQPGRVARAHERRQIVAGLLAAVGELGPYALRESDVIEAASTSDRRFRTHFDDLDGCFDFACEAALDTLLSPMVASWSVPRPPADRLGAAFMALLGSLAAQPRLAELCLLHSRARQRDRRTYRRVVNAVAELLFDVRGQLASPGPRVSEEEALARRIVGLIVTRLAVRGAENLEGLHPQLEELLAPHLGLDEKTALGGAHHLDGRGPK
jgi:AcrR family transcriptional regulator